MGLLSILGKVTKAVGLVDDIAETVDDIIDVVKPSRAEPVRAIECTRLVHETHQLCDNALTKRVGVTQMGRNLSTVLLNYIEMTGTSEFIKPGQPIRSTLQKIGLEGVGTQSFPTTHFKNEDIKDVISAEMAPLMRSALFGQVLSVHTIVRLVILLTKVLGLKLPDFVSEIDNSTGVVTVHYSRKEA